MVTLVRVRSRLRVTINQSKMVLTMAALFVVIVIVVEDIMGFHCYYMMDYVAVCMCCVASALVDSFKFEKLMKNEFK